MITSTVVIITARSADKLLIGAITLNDIQRLEQRADSLQFDQETIDKAIEAIQKIAEAIVDVWQIIVETVTSVFNTFWEALREFLLKDVNPKIYNLAFHHKKFKVRKKNQKKLIICLRGG